MSAFPGTQQTFPGQTIPNMNGQQAFPNNGGGLGMIPVGNGVNGLGGQLGQQPAAASFPNTPFAAGQQQPFVGGGSGFGAGNPQQIPVGSGVNQVPVGDCKTLKDIYQQLNGNNQQIINAMANCCSLTQFVTCGGGGGAITSLVMSSMNLNGGFPQSITALQSLQVLDLSFNPIGGSIPSNINDLTQLQWLALASTNVGGILPSSIGSMSNLKYLIVSRTGINGGFPVGLQRLQGLAFDGSALYGPLDLFQNSRSLQYLMANESALSGNLPELPSISFINVGSTNIGGFLPTSLQTAKAGSGCGFYNTQLKVPPNGVKPPGCEGEKFDGYNNLGPRPGAPAPNPLTFNPSIGMIVGIILGIFIVLGLIYWFYRRRRALMLAQQAGLIKKRVSFTPPSYIPPEGAVSPASPPASTPLKPVVTSTSTESALIHDGPEPLLKPSASLQTKSWRMSEPTQRLDPMLQFNSYKKEKAKQVRFDQVTQISWRSSPAP